MDEWQKRLQAMKDARQNRSSPARVTKPATTTSTGTSSSSPAGFRKAPQQFKTNTNNKPVVPARSASKPALPTASPVKATGISKTASTGAINYSNNRISGGGKVTGRLSNSGGVASRSSSASSNSSISAGNASRSSSSSSASSAGGDFKQLYEQEKQKSADLQQQLANKEKEVAQIKQKIVQLSASDHAKEVLSKGGNMGREIGILKTELKVLKMKHDSELRKREQAEANYKALLAKSNNNNNNNTHNTNYAKPASASAAEKRAQIRQSRVVNSNNNNNNAARRDIKSRRITMRKSKMVKKPNVVEMITKVLTEMAKLEAQIQTAEDGRLKAEGELVEVALYKQQSDDILRQVVNDVNVKMVVLSGQISQLNTIAASQPQPAKGKLLALKTKLESIKTDIQTRISDNTLHAASSPQDVSKRASILSVKLNVTPPPPPPQNNFTSSSSGRGNSGAASNSGASSLLDQIRKGKDLNKIDVEKMKKERAEAMGRRSNRKSLALLSSLQDTLRLALSQRGEDMNLYDDDDEDDEDDDFWE